VLQIERLLPADRATPAATATLTLRFAERCKSRLRARLDDGREAGLFLPRGTVLRAGDVLCAGCGTTVRVVAAAEDLYEVQASDDSRDPQFDLLRGAYHLGNRHVPLQLAPGCLRLERDGVLREMLLRLGLEVIDVVAAFEPEAGAYGGGHRHDHDVSGGMLGEQLSREAHAAPPDFAAMRFDRAR
jgi:urease accessory protein